MRRTGLLPLLALLWVGIAAGAALAATPDEAASGADQDGVFVERGADATEGDIGAAVAVARNAGEWLADSEYPWTGWIRKSNSLMTMVGGITGLMLAFIAADVLSALPFIRFFGGLLAFAGTLITLAAIQVGFGAVLLTRGGRQKDYWASSDPDVAWEAAMSGRGGADDGDVDVDQGGA